MAIHQSTRLVYCRISKFNSVIYIFNNFNSLPIKRLESLGRLSHQQTQDSGAYTSYRTDVQTFLNDIESNITIIRDFGRDLLDDEWIRNFETSVVPLDFLVSEVRPIIRKSIHGISPEELVEYSAGKVLENTFYTGNKKIEG
jgi:hypothetical protein